ncbi:hypothetical protein [Alishewanella sp. HH-ZS]|uniref:hypothetical protein n=1 Tax=Alishewanella sp. HH-ZS TaxID=1856684 RepID=UPI000823585C|nr:hypothetical protein [Alishewanella sp. HH-ZS]OCW92727.1 hypothetical protein A9165_16120 [Alishewanella sp. HH-ZS]
MEKKDSQASAMLVQKHQLDSSDSKISELDVALNALLGAQKGNDQALDGMLADMEALLAESGVSFDAQATEISVDMLSYVNDGSTSERFYIPQISLLDAPAFDENISWDSYVSNVEKYASEHDIDLQNDPFDRLLTPTQRISLEKRIKDEFTYKNANCDKYDYLLAGTCGVIGGLIDVFFVGLPGQGKLTTFTDKAVDQSVQMFAKAFGWKGAAEGGDATKSAIGFLERNFKVNYDQATTYGKNGTDGLVDNLSPKNHHLKSLGHSPDLVGLFFSILNQFTNTSTFVSNGKIITIETESFELQGSNFISKVFCGFVNWLGHLFSDMAGSSGASSRGAGIPIPFYNWLLLINVGEFGKHKQTFATIATKVFEQGYDFRHGLAMAIPVLITELLTRVMWVCKKRFYHKADWADCIPTANNPELRRMLLVAHGSLCLVDAGDAALRSGGDMVQFLLRTNLIGWVRFGHLAYKEVIAWHKAGHINADAVDEYLEREYSQMLVK